MSYISDKFNVPHETVKKMMQSGVISCAWEGWEEVYELRRQGKSMPEIALLTNRTTSSVSKILSKFPK